MIIDLTNSEKYYKIYGDGESEFEYSPEQGSIFHRKVLSSAVKLRLYKLCSDCCQTQPVHARGLPDQALRCRFNAKAGGKLLSQWQ